MNRRALKALMGRPDPDDNVLEQIWDKLKTLPGAKGDEHPELIATVLSSGAFMAPASQSNLGKALTSSLRSVQQGIIGTYLAGLQYFIVEMVRSISYGRNEILADSREQDEMNERQCSLTPATTFINDKCQYLLYKPLADRVASRSPEQKHIDALGKYGLSVEILVRDALACNNGKADKLQLTFEGDYPKCFFNLALVS